MLVFGGNAQAAARIATDLEHLGVQADSVTDESEARSKFFVSGGHRWLLITEDARPGPARRLAHSLRHVDPTLNIMVFGRGFSEQGLGHVHRVRSLHLGSRAGLGAVQRLLATH